MCVQSLLRLLIQRSLLLVLLFKLLFFLLQLLLLLLIKRRRQEGFCIGKRAGVQRVGKLLARLSAARFNMLALLLQRMPLALKR